MTGKARSVVESVAAVACRRGDLRVGFVRSSVADGSSPWPAPGPTLSGARIGAFFPKSRQGEFGQIFIWASGQPAMARAAHQGAGR